LNKDEDAVIKKNGRKGEKHEPYQSGSISPLYLRRSIGEIRMIGSGTRNSFRGLKETLRVPETQNVPSIEAIRSASLIVETSTQVNVK
jgi:hypothetical protein